jgi:hypothetical protein
MPVFSLARPTTLVIAVVVTTLILLGAASVSAQDAGIAGVVRETSGAVLPGVTVTATSPALIERERSSTSCRTKGGTRSGRFLQVSLPTLRWRARTSRRS